LQQPIEYRWKGDLIVTTPGRVIFNAEVERTITEAVGDDGVDVEYPYVNRTLSKKEMDDFITELAALSGAHMLGHVPAKIKKLGSRYATDAGITISKNDIVIPPDKQEILAVYEE